MKTMKTNSNNKWDEMRSQLAILNDKIENETIVDDRHIRHSMKNKVAWIHRYVRFEIFVLLPLLQAAGAAEYCIIQFSMGFVAFALFFIAADVIFDYIVNTRKMSGIFEGNLIVARRQLIEIKRLRTLRIVFSIPFTIIFILWLIYEVSRPRIPAIPRYRTLRWSHLCHRILPQHAANQQCAHPTNQRTDQRRAGNTDL